MIDRAADRPWEPERSRQCLRGRVLVRLAPGEAPERVPHYLDQGHVAPPLSVDGGRVDAVVKRFSPAMRVTHAFRSAHAIGSGDVSRPRWDDLEHSTGLSRTFRVEVDPDAGLLPLVSELRSLANVESATPHYLCTTPFSDPDVPVPADRDYAARLVGVDEALAFEPGDSALVVGIVDSGMDLDHEELRERVRPGTDTVDLPTPNLPFGVRLVGDSTHPDRIPRDEMGHGTACAGIIGARGLRLSRGIGGAARLVAGRALASAALTERGKLTAVGALPDIDQALKTLVDLVGVGVLNLSFGTPASALRDDDFEPHSEVVAYALQRGCVLVSASGNDGRYTKYFPAAHPGVIAVGSVGETSQPSAFTTRGDHVALCAPGEHIPSTAVGGYQTNTGTSFAAPFVAGACALLLARAARYGVPLEPETVRTFLTANARPFAVGADHRGCGAGILDVPAALRSIEHALATAERPSSRLLPMAGPGARARASPPPHEATTQVRTHRHPR